MIYDLVIHHSVWKSPKNVSFCNISIVGPLNIGSKLFLHHLCEFYERQNASFLMTKRWGRKWLLSFRKKGLRCRFSYSIKSSFPPDRPPSSFLAFATAAVTVVKGFNQKKGFWNWHAKMHSVQFLLAAAERKHWYWYSSTLSSMVRMKIPSLSGM